MIRCNQSVLAGFRFAVNAGGGTAAFVGYGPAPDASNRYRGVLAVAAVANHDWPSCLLPHWFDPDSSLCATFRWAKYSIGCGRFVCADFSPTDLLSPFHSRWVEPVLHRDDQGLQCLSVEVADHGSIDLLRDVYRHVAPPMAAQLRDEIERWLLSRNGVLRRVALCRGRNVENCSFLGVDIICSYVSYHLVLDTFHAGQCWVVSSFLILDVDLEILRNVVSCSGLEIDRPMGMILLPSFLPCCSSVISIPCRYRIIAWQMFLCWLYLTQGRV